MHIRGSSLIGSSIHASDGEIGNVTDILFDGSTWKVRYIVVTCDSGLDRKEVLLIPSVLQVVHPFKPILKTRLTQSQIESSPTVSHDLPVSRQFESELHSYYEWDPYWTYPLYTGFGLATQYPPKNKDQSQSEATHRPSDSHLRSFKEVQGYHIRAIDDELGHLEDILVDQEEARITHLVIDTINWLPSKHVLVESSFIDGFGWGSRMVSVRLDKATIKGAPEYDPMDAFDEDYLGKIAEYYVPQKSSEASKTQGIWD